MKTVKKAVFPVAGLGTRFLPATKASPKEMLPIVDKPLIQYAVEEAIAAGITELIFVTSSHKQAIEDHFDKNFELEYNLKKKNKQKLLDMVQNILPDHVSCAYVRQKEALGLGHAVLCAEPLVKNEPFAVILADDLIVNMNGASALEQMTQAYQQHHHGLIAVQQVAPSETGSYGIVSADSAQNINAVVEKPKPENAPSTQAIVGRYILNASIFNYLKNTPKGAGGEIQLTDAIAEQLCAEPVKAFAFDGVRYDCGNKLEFAIANFELTRQDEALGQDYMDYIRKQLD